MFVCDVCGVDDPSPQYTHVCAPSTKAEHAQGVNDTDGLWLLCESCHKVVLRAIEQPSGYHSALWVELRARSERTYFKQMDRMKLTADERRIAYAVKDNEIDAVLKHFRRTWQRWYAGAPHELPVDGQHRGSR